MMAKWQTNCNIDKYSYIANEGFVDVMLCYNSNYSENLQAPYTNEYGTWWLL